MIKKPLTSVGDRVPTLMIDILKTTRQDLLYTWDALINNKMIEHQKL